MADSVIIKDIGPGLEEWASEESMKDMIKLLKKSVDLNEKQLKKLSQSIKAGEENSEELQDAIGGLGDQQGSANADARNRDREDRKRNKEGGSAKFINKYLSKTFQEQLPKSGLLKDLGDSLAKSTGASDSFANTLVMGAATMAAVFASTSAKITSAYVEVYRAGTIVGDASATTAEKFAVFNQALSTANLSVEELQAITTTYGKTINKVGIKQFAKAAGVFQEGAKEFGLTANTAATYLADYTERQRIQGTLEDMTSQRAQRRAMKDLKVTTAFAQALGKSTEALNKELTEELQDIDMQAALSTLPDDLQAATQASIKGVPEPLRQMFLEMLTYSKGFEGSTNSAIEMSAAGGKAYVDAMAEIAFKLKDGQIDQTQVGAEFAKALRKANAALGDSEEINRSANMGQLASGKSLIGMQHGVRLAAEQLEQFPVAIEDGIVGAVTGMDNTGKALAETGTRLVAETLAKSAEEFEKTIGKIDDATEKLIPLQKKGISAASDIASIGLNAVASAAGEAAVQLGRMLDAMNGVGPDSVGDLAKGAMSSENVGVAAAGAGILYASKKFGADLFKNFRDKFREVSDDGTMKKAMKAFKKTGKQFLTRIPVVGGAIAGGIGMLDGIMDVFKTEDGFLSEFYVVVRETLRGILDGFIGIPTLIASAFDFVFGTETKELVKQWGDALRTVFDLLDFALTNMVNKVKKFFGKEVEENKPMGIDYKEVNRQRAEAGRAPMVPPERTSVKPPAPIVDTPKVESETQTASSNSEATSASSINTEDPTYNEMKKVTTALNIIAGQNAILLEEAKKTARNTAENQSGLLS